jgi:CubicO group peptidase (beta-lactamase class C family)
MRWKSVFVSTLLLVSIPLFAGDEVKLQEHAEVADAITVFERWIELHIAHHAIPGLSIAVVHDQEIVWAKGYGFADVENEIPATPSTVYRIGSITKVFTSTAILQLRDSGKLRLDDPVAMHLPWFSVRNPFPAPPEITIRQLLTHTSGLPRDAAFPSWTDHIFPTREELAEAVPDQSLINVPETTYRYSNLGMALLGEIVTEVSGQPWADYVDEKILQPLGMRGSSTAPGEKLLQRLATGYMRLMPDGTRKVFDYYETGAIAPAASIVSTVEDLSLFVSLQFRDGPVGDHQILKGSTLREMHQIHWAGDNTSGGRGLGFDVSRREGKTVVGKTGTIGGHVNRILMVPSEKIGVVVSLNADDGSTFGFATQAYEVLGPALLRAARKPEAPKREADPTWQRYLGLYTDPWGWEYEVLILGGDLFIYDYYYPPYDNAASGYSRLTPVEGTTFRMPDNELLTFELDENGNVVRIKRRSDYIFPKKNRDQ